MLKTWNEIDSNFTMFISKNIGYFKESTKFQVLSTSIDSYIELSYEHFIIVRW
nr:MAG TPA: hypothetical protein [Caudoviricetes sp.]